MQFRKSLLALLTISALVLGACGSSKTTTPSADSKPAASQPATPAPAQSKPAPAPSKNGGTLRVAYNTEPSSLAPWRSGDTNTHYVYQALYNALVEQNDKMEIVPGLAESWSVSPDGLKYTFKLRKGVKFHDGEAFNANAAKFMVDLWTVNLPKDGINKLNGVKSYKVVDEYTFEMELETPNNQFLITMASKLRSMLSPKAVQAAGEDFGRKPVGTGPFKFDKWVTDSTITLVKNPDYWEKDAGGAALPFLDKMEFKKIPDATVRRTALLTGEIDFDTAVAADGADEVSKAGMTLFNKPGMGYVALRVLTTKAPFDKKEVRQALAWAADREAINKAIYFGKAFPGYTMYSPPTPGFKDTKAYGPRNVAKAKELLTKAGYANGFEMELIIASSASQPLAELIQAQYKEIGVTVKIKMLERGTFLDGIGKRQHISYIDGIAGRTDPNAYYEHLACGFIYNGHDYCNKELDQMSKDGISKFTNVSDPKRLELYQKMEAIVLEDMPLIPLIHPPLLHAWSSKFDGVSVTPAGRIFWTQAFQAKK